MGRMITPHHDPDRLPLPCHERLHPIPVRVNLLLAHGLHLFAGQRLLLCEDRLRRAATTGAELVAQEFGHVARNAGELTPDASEVGTSVLSGFDGIEVY